MTEHQPLVHNDKALCKTLFDQGKNQIIYRILVADTQTAVGAMLKLANGETHHCLLESVEGGEIRGRFSVIGLKPDLIWRSKGKHVSINKDVHTDPENFTSFDCDNPFDSLRELIAQSAM